MRLGEFVKLYREHAEMSIRDFARVSGLSPAYISMLENNKKIDPANYLEFEVK